MSQKKPLKPTLLIALDPFAAAFCAETRRRLVQQVGPGLNENGTLIQACAFTVGPEGPRFDLNIDEYLDPEREYTAFDLNKVPACSETLSFEAAEWIAGNWQDEAADTLSEILLQACSLDDIETARRNGLDISDTRSICLVLSSSCPFAVRVVLELARVIHWLFDTRFYNEVNTLDALVLLPELFANHARPHYVTTYGLLKIMDDAFQNGLSITTHLTSKPFEDCWLIDGHNQRVIGTGTLAENLAGYADAFVGLLRAGPEDSMPPPGINAQGRPPAYNSFGYGELYFPSDIVLTRLSATLANDITRRFFMGESETRISDEVQLLDDVKRFTESKEFTRQCGLVRSNREGQAIWKPFYLKNRPNESASDEYIELLRHQRAEFEKTEMAEYRTAISDSRKRVLTELRRLLDHEVDRRVDASPTGLQDSRDYLQILVEPAIQLRIPSTDGARNLLTVRSEINASLDADLSVTPVHDQSALLFEEILSLSNRLSEIRTELRILPESTHHSWTSDVRYTSHIDEQVSKENEDRESTILDQEDSEVDPLDLPPIATPYSSGDHRQQLVADIAEAEERLRSLSSEYRFTLDTEDTETEALRNEAIKTVATEHLQKIEHNEKVLVSLPNELHQARRIQEQLVQARQRFVRRYFVEVPGILAAIVSLVLLLGWVADIGPALTLFTLILDDLSEATLLVMLVVVLYFLGVFTVLFRGLRTRIAEANARVAELVDKLQIATTRLLDSHNAYEYFKYKLYAWRTERELITRLVETVHSRIRELMDRLDSLRESADIFAQERDDASPVASVMRRPLILAAEIDAYYNRKITSIETEGNLFVQKYKVPRSRIRLIPAEEFRNSIRSFALDRFKDIRNLSITDALLNYPDLVPEETAELRLRQLNEAAEPLLRLNPVGGVGAGRLAQRDTTLWMSVNERERMQRMYLRICPNVNIRISDYDSALRVLTRCLHFPAYFISFIRFYKSRYEGSAHKIADELPDVLPADRCVEQARKRFFLALATGVVILRSTGIYTFSDSHSDSFGSDRLQIPKWLCQTFEGHKRYIELNRRLDSQLNVSGSVINQLSEFLDSARDFNTTERQVLTALLNEYV